MAANAAPLQRRSSRRAFIVAVLFGLLAAFLALSFLRSAKDDDGGRSVAMVPAVVAVRDIPERTVVKEGMVEVKQFAPDARHNLALAERELVVGQVTRQPIAAGEQVLRNKIADGPQAVGFSNNIPQGKRAVAVEVNEVVATGGHIGVGDFVDVIGVFEVHDPDAKNTAASSQGDKAKPYVAVTLLQNIQVLAVAQRSEPTLQSSGKSGDNQSSKASEAKSVTLALTPEQAEKIFLAEEIGVLRLSLRPFGDDEQRKIAPVTNDLPSIVGQ
jgi:pilus assembly protein CpaB